MQIEKVLISVIVLLLEFAFSHGTVLHHNSVS